MDFLDVEIVNAIEERAFDGVELLPGSDERTAAILLLCLIGEHRQMRARLLEFDPDWRPN